MRRVEHLMGTVFSFDIRTPGEHTAALDHAVRWLHWVDVTFSPFRTDSEISRLASGELRPDAAHTVVRQVLRDIASISAATGGYFSAAAGGRLDPCGYVKGWAVERVSRYLALCGAVDHVVNGGGDVRTSGRPGRRDWGVGIVDPFRPERIARRVDAPGIAVATSGTAARGAHVLDPHTGRPAVALASLTVLGPDLAVADAYATAGVAMGRQARDWLAALPDYRSFAITADGDRWTA